MYFVVIVFGEKLQVNNKNINIHSLLNAVVMKLRTLLYITKLKFLFRGRYEMQSFNILSRVISHQQSYHIIL